MFQKLYNPYKFDKIYEQTGKTISMNLTEMIELNKILLSRFQSGYQFIYQHTSINQIQFNITKKTTVKTTLIINKIFKKFTTKQKIFKQPININQFSLRLHYSHKNHQAIQPIQNQYNNTIIINRHIIISIKTNFKQLDNKYINDSPDLIYFFYNLSNNMNQQSKQESQNGFARLLRESEIQPQRKGNVTFGQKFWGLFDIFSYIPTPQSYPVSTKKSRCGSICLLLLFFGYFAYVFVEFIINNTPKVNSYQLPLANQNYTVPQMAIGFIYGPNLNQTLNDSSIFTINLLQVDAPVGVKDTQIPLNMSNCPNNLQWLGGEDGVQTYYQNLSCIYPNNFSWAGLLYASNMTYYPRFSINLCNFTNASLNCASNDTMYNTTSGGRVFLFIQRDKSINYAKTQKSQPSNEFGNFYMYNYFLVPFLYNRVILTFQPTIYKIYPDYLTSFTTKQLNEYEIIDQQLQVSNVSNYNLLNMFSISIVLSAQVMVHQVVYQTLIDMISLAGAFWGVLFALFAFVFLSYNKRKFFEERPDWQSFEQKVNELEKRLNLSERI